MAHNMLGDKTSDSGIKSQNDGDPPETAFYILVSSDLNFEP